MQFQYYEYTFYNTLTLRFLSIKAGKEVVQPSKEIDNKRNPLNTALISVFWASVAIFIQRSYNQKQRCSLCQIRKADPMPCSSNSW